MKQYPIFNIIIPQLRRNVKVKDELFTNNSHFLPSVRELGGLFAQTAAESLQEVNRETVRYGLTLTHEEVAAVVLARREALADTGRVDFSGELPAKFARAFCDSPEVSPGEWASLLGELILLFYEAKNSFDPACVRGKNVYAMADDALIARMRRWFDYPARGSLDCLADLLLGMADRLHHGLDADEPDRRTLLFMGLDADGWLDARPEELLWNTEGEDTSLISHILDHD